MPGATTAVTLVSRASFFFLATTVQDRSCRAALVSAQVASLAHYFPTLLSSATQESTVRISPGPQLSRACQAALVSAQVAGSVGASLMRTAQELERVPPAGVMYAADLTRDKKQCHAGS